MKKHPFPDFVRVAFVTHDARAFVMDSEEIPLTALGGTGTYFYDNIMPDPRFIPVVGIVPAGTGGSPYPVAAPVPLIDQPQFTGDFFRNLNPVG